MIILHEGQNWALFETQRRASANADVGEHACGRVVWHALGTACTAVRNEEIQTIGTS